MNCFFLSLREKASYDEVNALIGEVENPKVALLPDLSFAVFDHAKEHKADRFPFPTSKHPKTIGLTIVDWENEGNAARENYKEVIISVIDYYVKAGSNIVIIPQVTKQWEAFDLLLSEVMETIRDMENVSIIEGNPTIFELFSIYSKIDVLIATRMHSAIFSAFVGTPLVVIPYDKGGKWNIIKDLGYDSQSINYSNVSTKVLIDAVNNCWNNKNEILKFVNGRVKQSASSVEHNISMLIESSPFKDMINNR
jgi:polysaccharide pyruvyl transferase WcaK-like protein